MQHTVLVCDDAAFMRAMLGDILTQAGHDVIGEAQSGGEAVQKFRELRPDLATMDLLMPGMGGIDAVREIVAIDPTPACSCAARWDSKPWSSRPSRRERAISW